MNSIFQSWVILFGSQKKEQKRKGEFEEVKRGEREGERKRKKGKFEGNRK